MISTDELGHSGLVDGRRGMFYARRNIFTGLVQAARAAGAFAIFVQRSCRGSHRGARAGFDAGGDNRTIRRGSAMGASAGLDAVRVGRVVRASLSPRRATMAGVDCLWPAHAGAGSQFPFQAES